MTPTTALLLAFSLSMDAFAAALGEGAASGETQRAPQMLRCAGSFGLFAMVMPLLGWWLGTAVLDLVEAYDHWIAFGLLAWIGGNMVRESLKVPEADAKPRELTVGAVLLTSLATSIDTAAVGVSLAVVQVSIVGTAALFGAMTFVMSCGGLLLGGAAGPLLGRRAELVGGLGLIAIGSKILLEHTLLA